MYIFRCVMIMLGHKSLFKFETNIGVYSPFLHLIYDSGMGTWDFCMIATMGYYGHCHI